MNNPRQITQKILASKDKEKPFSIDKKEEEGGCGVIGLACADQIAGKHLLPALYQMRNRGNGKGGGIAAAGLSPNAFGVHSSILEQDYLLAIAYLDKGCQRELEQAYIQPIFEIDHVYNLSHLSNFKTLKGLTIAPPEAILYFVRVKERVIQAFKERHQLHMATNQVIEDEIVYQNSYQLNRAFYASTGQKKAFVLSHGKNLLVLKMVGYGDDVIRYYKLEDFQAHVWIGHHRYPTKGKVWHPGGAHPFIGLHEALVHNGDFANYFSICEYLSQRHIYPLFLTDTEVSALVFDLLYRHYRYPLEYVIEAFAPTTERDFTLLTADKQYAYQLLHKTHMHGSPDGPWFFLIAQSIADSRQKPLYRLIGITDTSMLRPQVFALQTGSTSIGFAASEKQAIDAVLASLSKEGPFWSRADYYWSARGGSYTDGGAFIFTVQPQANGKAQFVCSNKFADPVHQDLLKPPYQPGPMKIDFSLKLPDLPAEDLFKWIVDQLKEWNYEQFYTCLQTLIKNGMPTTQSPRRAIQVLTKLLDHPYPTGHMRRSCLLALVDKSLDALMESIHYSPTKDYAYLHVDGAQPHLEMDEQTVIIDARGFPAEGNLSLAREMVEMYKKGFKNFIIMHCQGHRFIGNGLGPHSHGVHIDVYGSSGDYLASGIDGAKIYVHGTAQDQLAQIMKEGKLVVYGNVGQTFMYGAKGGEAFIQGHAAGRPLINAVGNPRVVINGTCLDYLAESFMAGDPLKGGGFVIINGLTFDENGGVIELDTPYSGNNLFSLASGGAIYIRDPAQKVTTEQLNGGEFVNFTQEDWNTILPYLEENAQLFPIPIRRLLEYAGKVLSFHQVYRKITPSHIPILQQEEAWVKGHT